MTKLKNRWLLWILPLAFFVFRKSDEGQWENKQISFPDNIAFTKAGKYTLQYTISTCLLYTSDAADEL